MEYDKDKYGDHDPFGDERDSDAEFIDKTKNLSCGDLAVALAEIPVTPDEPAGLDAAPATAAEISEVLNLPAETNGTPISPGLVLKLTEETAKAQMGPTEFEKLQTRVSELEAEVKALKAPPRKYTREEIMQFNKNFFNTDERLKITFDDDPELTNAQKAVEE